MGRLTSILVAITLMGILFVVIVLDPFGLREGDDLNYLTQTSVQGTRINNSWSQYKASSASVMYDAEEHIYKMWFIASGKLNRSGVAYATSNDGIDWVWDINSEPVLTRELVWEDGGIRSVTVIKYGNLYHMWYAAEAYNDDNRRQIGYATSSDGLKWAKNANNPVLTYGTAGEWDEHSVEQPTVIREDNKYHMWFAGSNASPDDNNRRTSIGYATSSDGVRWKRDNANPVLRGENEWDEAGVGGPQLSVHHKNKLYEMWYHGIDKKGRARLGHAFSADKILWAIDDQNPLIEDGDTSFYDPYVLPINTEYYMWTDEVSDRGNINSVSFTTWPPQTTPKGQQILPTFVPTIIGSSQY